MNHKAFQKAVRTHKRFLISTHVQPDLDGLCCELAMALYLRSLGKKVQVINAEKIPSAYAFLPFKAIIREYQYPKVPYDVAIILDSGELKRIGPVVRIIAREKILINIDHHVTNHHFGDIPLVDSKASSTAEVLYDLFGKVKFKLTKTVANLLYLGIMTDTGSFRYENTSAKTHDIVSRLMAFGVPVSGWFEKVYENVPSRDLRHLNKIIGDFKVSHGGQVVSLCLTKNRTKDSFGMFDLRDKIFSFLRMIQGPCVFVLLTQVSRDRTRVNFRSRAGVDVARLASRFKGGGHSRASGCWVESDIDSARKMVFKELKKVLPC